ncbi:MAG: hypothetical protein HUU38_11615 [Anaerolineales bacterium]|nr:hypothetical protein [Anaerolineales bacterium]
MPDNRDAPGTPGGAQAIPRPSLLAPRRLFAGDPGREPKPTAGRAEALHGPKTPIRRPTVCGTHPGGLPHAATPRVCAPGAA